jgi:hypothetical protein
MGFAILLLFGFAFVLPQVVGFAAARYGRWAPALAWPLGAAGTVALYVAIYMVVDFQMAEQARTAGQDRCGWDMATSGLWVVFFMGLHAVVGGILGGYEQERQRRLWR